MCVTSMVMDHYRDSWFKFDQPPMTIPYQPMLTANDVLIADLRKRLDAQDELVKKMSEQFEEMKKLLERAKEYDVKNNEPDCEVDEKVQLMMKLAEMLGVDPGSVLRGEAK